MKSYYFFIIMLFFFIFPGCEPEDELSAEPIPESPEGLTGPRIEIMQPQEMETFNFGDTIRISGKIEHIFTLHEYLLQIEELEKGEMLLQDVEHVHAGTRVELNTYWVHEMEEGGDVLLSIRANDHGDLFNHSERRIRCLPR